jgi:hypothetical protein
VRILFQVKRRWPNASRLGRQGRRLRTRRPRRRELALRANALRLRADRRSRPRQLVGDIRLWERWSPYPRHGRPFAGRIGHDPKRVPQTLWRRPPHGLRWCAHATWP